MHPILTTLRVGGIERPIGSFGLMLSLAMIVCSVLSVRAAVRAGIDPGRTIALVGFVATGAFAGAFSLFAVVEWMRTGAVLAGFETGGLVFFGAPLGGGLALLVFGRALDLPLGRLVDVSVPGIAAAHAVGRLGCFLGGCCYGRLWDGPWAVRYTNPIAPASVPPLPRHPSPLYESAALLALAFVFALVPLRKVGSGHRLLLYFAAYAVIRVMLEHFRGDTVRGLFFDGAFSTSQIIGCVVFLCIAAVLVLAKRSTSVPIEAPR